MFFSLIAAPICAFAAPTITDVTCSISYTKADQTANRGVYYDRVCPIYFYFTSPDIKHIVSCKLSVGDTSCAVSASAIQELNSLIQTYGNADDINFTLLSALLGQSDIAIGCLEPQGVRGISPTDTNTRCTPGASTCRVDTQINYTCVELPALDLQNCVDEYNQCLTTNTARRAALSTCKKRFIAIASEMHFGTDLALCRRHVDACNNHNSLLGAEIDRCQSG